ncbi:MAG: carbohydrate-binding protein [Eubacterium sp.]
MTNHGFGEALNPFIKTDASYATHVRLDGFKSGCYLTEKGKNLHPLINITDGNCVEYKDFNFETDNNDLYFSADLLPRKGGKIHIVLDNPSGTPVGTLNISPMLFKKYVEISTHVGKITGIHTLYLRFESTGNGKICDLASFKFFVKHV